MRIIKDENNHYNNMPPEVLKKHDCYSWTIVFDFPKDLYDLVLEYANTYGVFVLPDVKIGVALCSPHEQFNKKKGRELATSRMLTADVQIYDISIDRVTTEARCFATFPFCRDRTIEFRLVRYKKHNKIHIELSNGYTSMVRTLKHILTSEAFKKEMMLQQMEQIMMGSE